MNIEKKQLISVPLLTEQQLDINQELFSSFQKRNIILNGSINDNTWIVFDYFRKTRGYIRFNLDNILVKDWEILLSNLKSWTLYLLEKNYNPITTTRKVSILLEIINYTNGFKKEKLEDFCNISRKVSVNTWKHKMANLKEFLSFFNLKIDDDYTDLINIFLGQKYNNKRRELPKSDDVLKFNLIIDDFFENKASTEKFIIFFPILFWWKFTNIIPIRISEFCYIRKDAFNPANRTISIPRSKKMLNSELTYQELCISEKLSNTIEKYLGLTKDFNNRETLISYEAYIESTNQTSIIAEFTESYYYTLFDNLLNKFYREIVFELYDYKLNNGKKTLYSSESKVINKIIAPNDTRYFAFINLMLQGYHPVEIANLGGHSNLHSQIGYYNHIEHWIDSDIMNLYNLNQGLYNDMEIYFEQHLEINKKIVPKSLIGKTYIPLDIGYCTDPHQNCEVDNHYICPYWRISNDEYIKHEEVILSDLNNNEQKISAVFKNLIALHKSSVLNAKDERLDEKNINYGYKLKNSARAIKDALFKLSVLRSNLKNGET